VKKYHDLNANRQLGQWKTPGCQAGSSSLTWTPMKPGRWRDQADHPGINGETTFVLTPGASYSICEVLQTG